MTHELLVEYPFLLALLVFFARVADVALGTVRTIFIFRGRKFIAAFIGFFEIMIWLVAAGQVFANLDKWYLALSFAGGFSIGNYVGIWIEGRLAMGSELIRCISFHRDVLAEKIRQAGFKVVSFDGNMGTEHPVEVLFVVEKRRNVPALIRLIKELDESAVYSVSDLKSVYDGPLLLPRRSFLASALALSGKRR